MWPPIVRARHVKRTDGRTVVFNNTSRLKDGRIKTLTILEMIPESLKIYWLVSVLPILQLYINEKIKFKNNKSCRGKRWPWHRSIYRNLDWRWKTGLNILDSDKNLFLPTNHQKLLITHCYYSLGSGASYNST